MVLILQTLVFWDMTLYYLFTSILEAPVAPIFYSEDEDSMSSETCITTYSTTCNNNDDNDDDMMMMVMMMIKNRTKICNTMKGLPLMQLFLYAAHLK